MIALSFAERLAPAGRGGRARPLPRHAPCRTPQSFRPPTTACLSSLIKTKAARSMRCSDVDRLAVRRVNRDQLVAVGDERGRGVDQRDVRDALSAPR